MTGAVGPHRLESAPDLARAVDMHGNTGTFIPNFQTHDFDPLGQQVHRDLVNELAALKKGELLLVANSDALWNHRHAVTSIVKHINRKMGRRDGVDFIIMRDGEREVHSGRPSSTHPPDPRTLCIDLEKWRISLIIEVESIGDALRFLREHYAGMLGEPLSREAEEVTTIRAGRKP